MHTRRISTDAHAVRGRARLAIAIVLVAGAAGLVGCVESLPHTRLPELAKDPKPVLTPDQQKAATVEAKTKQTSKREEALREIEAKR